MSRTVERSFCHKDTNLVVGCSESPVNILVVKNCHLECEILLHVLDNHNKERQLDAKCLLRVRRARYKGRADIATSNFEHGRLDLAVCDTFNMSVADCTGK